MRVTSGDVAAGCMPTSCPWWADPSVGSLIWGCGCWVLMDLCSLGHVETQLGEGASRGTRPGPLRAPPLSTVAPTTPPLSSRPGVFESQPSLYLK